ncbi:MAG: hypothetical protein WC807_19710 [Hyphomicrobium sp.]
MAKNKETGDDHRVGAVKSRSQVKNPVTGTWTKRDAESGKFMDVKADPKPFKGVRKEKAATPAAKKPAAKKPAAKKK